MTNCLLILMTVDYITGLSKAYCTKTLMGNIGIKNLTLGILISNEGLSILENCSICGVPIPNKLKELLEQYRGNKG